MTIEIVTVNGKQWASLSGANAKKISKFLVISAGGQRFRWNDGIIYRVSGAWGDLEAYYQSLVDQAIKSLEA